MKIVIEKEKRWMIIFIMATFGVLLSSYFDYLKRKNMIHKETITMQVKVKISYEDNKRKEAINLAKQVVTSCSVSGGSSRTAKPISAKEFKPL